jgi:hypothetical protein
MNSTTVAVDLAKSVFQLAVTDASWKVLETYRFTVSPFEAGLSTKMSAWYRRRLFTPPSQLAFELINDSMNDGYIDDADSMSARDIHDPTLDAG